MTRLHQMRRGILALLVLVSSWTSAGAAPDDGEPPVAVDPQANNGFMIQEANFDQWVFQGSGNAAAGRARIQSLLKLKLDELVRICELKEAQKQKLTLAARGDMKRFFDEVEVVRKKFLAVRNDQNAFNNIWQEIGPLQQRQAAGLFGETSIFAKTLRKTLTAEQQESYLAVVEERRRFRYRAALEVSLNTLSGSVGLRHEQHEALLKLMVEETPPMKLFGQYDHYAVLYQMSKLPTQKVKGLVDERQWKLLQPHFDQGRGMEAHLVQNGIIDQAKESSGGILKSVRKFLDATNTEAEKPDNAASGQRDAPVDAQKPEQPRTKATP